MTPRLQLDFSGDRVLLDGRDVTDEIRTSRVSAAVYLAADNPQVREKMVEMQQKIAGARDTVTEGRDQGTVAFRMPSAKSSSLPRRKNEPAAAMRSSNNGEKKSAFRKCSPRMPPATSATAPARGPARQSGGGGGGLHDGMTTEQVIHRLEEIVRESQKK